MVTNPGEKTGNKRPVTVFDLQSLLATPDQKTAQGDANIPFREGIAPISRKNLTGVDNGILSGQFHMIGPNLVWQGSTENEFCDWFILNVVTYESQPKAVQKLVLQFEKMFA